MPRGDKSKYTDKQKRQAEHIEEGYEARGVPEGEAERRAWATVNSGSGGGKKSGSGRGKTETHASSRKGGRLGAGATAARPQAARTLAVCQEGRRNAQTPCVAVADLSSDRGIATSGVKRCSAAPATKTDRRPMKFRLR
jgi:plasmid stabilization system protein ParE